MNRKFRDIDATVRGLNSATDAHFKWLVKVLRYVASREGDLPETPAPTRIIIVNLDTG